MSEDSGKYLKNIKVDLSVGITTRENRNNIVKGLVSKILTRSEHHTHGIMVELKDGTVGRVKQIYDSIDHGITINESTNDYVPEQEKIDNPLGINREPIQTSITIDEDATGYSYENLFYPYIKNAKKITIEDAYIRAEHQIKNLVFFCTIIPDNEEQVELKLVTGPDEYNHDEQKRKLNELRNVLSDMNVIFTFDFDKTLHDRSIITDTGWDITLGRGFDMFKKADSFYSPSNFDQTKKKCYKTKINYMKAIVNE